MVSSSRALLCLVAVVTLAGCQDAPLAPASSPASAELAGKAPPAVYRIYLSNVNVAGLSTDCAQPTDGYVLAQALNNGTLSAASTITHVDGSAGPPFQIRVATSPEVRWERTYDVGKGTEGVFNDCFGATSGPNGGSGNLFLFFENVGGQPTVRFTWHFDYYVTARNVTREHFTLHSANIPFPVLTSDGADGNVSGSFDLEYYLKEGKNILSLYDPIPGGTDLPFEFNMRIVRETSPSP